MSLLDKLKHRARLTERQTIDEALRRHDARERAVQIPLTLSRGSYYQILLPDGGTEEMRITGDVELDLDGVLGNLHGPCEFQQACTRDRKGVIFYEPGITPRKGWQPLTFRDFRSDDVLDIELRLPGLPRLKPQIPRDKIIARAISNLCIEGNYRMAIGYCTTLIESQRKQIMSLERRLRVLEGTHPKTK